MTEDKSGAHSGAVERGFVVIGHNRGGPPLHAGYELRNTSLMVSATVSEAITEGLNRGEWPRYHLYRVQRRHEPTRWVEVAGSRVAGPLAAALEGTVRHVSVTEHLVPGAWGPWIVQEEVV